MITGLKSTPNTKYLTSIPQSSKLPWIEKLSVSHATDEDPHKHKGSNCTPEAELG